MSKFIGRCTNCDGCSDPLDEHDNYCPWCNQHCLVRIEVEQKPSETICRKLPEISYPNRCPNCNSGGYGEGLCTSCRRAEEQKACRTWSKFLRAFDAKDACIDVTDMTPSQLKRMDGLLALYGRHFEIVTVSTKVGTYNVLFRKQLK